MKTQSSPPTRRTIPSSPRCPPTARCPSHELGLPRAQRDQQQQLEWIDGGIFSVLLDKDATDGQLTVGRFDVAKGEAPPYHMHTREDEIFLLIKGTALVWAGDEETSLGEGGIVFLPRNIPHAYRITSERADLLLITTPGGNRGHVPSCRARPPHAPARRFPDPQGTPDRGIGVCTAASSSARPDNPAPEKKTFHALHVRRRRRAAHRPPARHQNQDAFGRIRERQAPGAFSARRCRRRPWEGAETPERAFRGPAWRGGRRAGRRAVHGGPTSGRSRVGARVGEAGRVAVVRRVVEISGHHPAPLQRGDRRVPVATSSGTRNRGW